MSSYRIARRSFMRSVGAGAVGLKIMLRTMEASAQGAGPPPRFLMTHWPVGTIKYMFQPSATGTAFNLTNAPILQPFETAGLLKDTIILYGLNSSSYHGAGGGHESGTPQTSTGARTPGVRQNGGEGDDACAGGPSWDQIFLKNVPALQTPGVGYVNAICDARVDSLETSTQCLSYDYATRSIPSAAGGSVTENIPLLPTLGPLALYTKLFGSFMPGGGGTPNDMTKLLRARKSVLDSARAQLARLKTLAPGSQASKIDIHADAIRKVEDVLTTQINMGTIVPGMCTPPGMPANLQGMTGSRNDYKAVGSGPTTASVDDSPNHAAIADAHMDIIRTAMQCDLIRVATFQFSPGTNHVSFKGLYPGNANGIYMHHPTSHQISDANDSLGTSLPPAGLRQEVVQFLANVNKWYNEKMAAMLVKWKNTTDVRGGNLLANTIIPYVTEVSQTTHSWSPMPALIFGGSALGMKGGQYQNFSRPHNDLWISIAQAYFKSTTPLTNLPTTEKFVRTGVAPIPGLWAPPA